MERLSREGEALSGQGRPAEAERRFRRALAIADHVLGPDSLDVARSADGLAGVLQDEGRYDEAELLSRRALAIAEKTLGPKQADTAAYIDNLATLLQAEGQFAEAETLHRQALGVFETTVGLERPETAGAMDNLALLLEAEGRFSEAEPLFRRALATYEKTLGEDHAEAATTAGNLAGLLRAQGRLAEARVLLLRALAIDERALGPGHPDTAIAMDNLAALLQAEGQTAEAEPLQRRALAILQRRLGPNHPDTATAMDNLAVLLQAKGRYREAEPLLRRVLAVREANLGRSHIDTAETYETLGFNEERQGLFAQAVERYRLACALHSTTAAIPEHGSEAARAAKIRSTDCATRLSLALWGWAERGGGPADRPGALMREGFLSAQRALQSAAGEALARSAALEAARAAGVGEAAEAYEAALAERDALDRDFAKAAGEPALAGDETRASLRKARDAVTARIAALGAKLQAGAPRYWEYRAPEPVDAAALQATSGPDAALLGENEALILFLVPPAEDRGLVFAVSKQGFAWARIGLTGEALRAQVGRLRNRIEARRQAFDREASFNLYQALLGDPAIQAVIRDKPVLLFTPSGPLNSLPPGILVTAPPEGGAAGDADQARLRATAWLLRSKAVALLPAVSSLKTLRELMPANRPAADDPMLAFADPDFSGARGTAGAPAASSDPAEVSRGGQAMGDSLRRLPRLPGTRKEGEALEAVLGARPGSLLTGADASKAELMSRNADGRLAKVRVLEFATHGLVAGAADWLSEPALALAAGPKPQDQLLLASDAATLKLNADWVLLSACDTASPDAPEAEGLSGLSRAFFFAGARSLLISHWPVRDDVAARLIPATLLAERQTPGLSRAEALREASLAIIDAPALRAANPVAWAPFTLVGEAGR